MKINFTLIKLLTLTSVIMFDCEMNYVNGQSVKKEELKIDSLSHIIIIKNIESIGEMMQPAIVICNDKGEIKRIQQKLFSEANFDSNLKNLTKALNDYYSKGYRLVGTTVTGKIN